MITKIYDITVPISNKMLVWPGDPEVELQQVESIEQGAESNVSQLTMSVHTGTHIDAPKHYITNGITIDQISMNNLIGKVFVMAISKNIPVITNDVMEQHPAYNALTQVSKVLFKTRNSDFWHVGRNEFNEDYVGLDSSAAQHLANLGMTLVGVDYLSIAPFTETERPHKILLEKEVVLLEGIDLSKVPEGFYELYCLPLLLQGCEGSPARAILIPAESPSK
jgi:arylformamidase